MEKKKIILISAAGVILAGLGFYLYKQKQAADQTTQLPAPAADPVNPVIPVTSSVLLEPTPIVNNIAASPTAQANIKAEYLATKKLATSKVFHPGKQLSGAFDIR